MHWLHLAMRDIEQEVASVTVTVRVGNNALFCYQERYVKLCSLQCEINASVCQYLFVIKPESSFVELFLIYKVFQINIYLLNSEYSNSKCRNVQIRQEILILIWCTLKFKSLRIFDLYVYVVYVFVASLQAGIKMCVTKL